MQAKPNLDFTTVEPEKASLKKFVEMLRQVYQNLVRVINGNLGFGDGTKTDNIDGNWINVVAPAAPNTDFTVNHNLQRLPVGYWVMVKDRACDVYTGSVLATKTQITLRATVASAVLRLFVIVLVLFLGTLSSNAQTTNVTIQVTDAGGQSWNNGSWQATLVTPPGVVPFGPPFFLVGTQTPVPNQNQTGVLSGSGSATITMTQNSVILPALSQWKITVCALTTAANNCFVQFTVVTAATSLTITPPTLVVRGNDVALAYSDSEVQVGIGGIYFNVTTGAMRECLAATGINCTTWQNIGGGGGVLLQTNGVTNTVQNILNILQGTGIGIASDAFGNLTFTNTAPNKPTFGSAGTVQASDGVGGHQLTGCRETGTTLNCVDDPNFRGPNLGVSVTSSPFFARAINPSSIPATNCSITGGTNSASCTSATGLQVGDGYAITTAGSTQSMTTPAAPTVTPSCAAGPTGLGFTVPAGTGSATYQYQLAMRDQGQGLTAAGTAGTTSTGNATLGSNSTVWTSSASGTTNTFTATVGSTANLASGCLVVLKGSTDDAEFGGWKIVASVVDGTHFTYTSGIDASRGISTTTSTGGTVTYWLCNHVVLPTPGGVGTQYAIYGRTAGSMTFLQMSLLANLGYTDPTYNTFDDYGSPMMDGGPRPWFVPTTPPGSPTNDTFTSTIATVVGNTLTFAGNAPNSSIGSAASRFDNAPNILAAITASNSTSVTGAGGTIRFPVVTENSGTGNYCYVTSSYIVATVQAIIQDGAVCPGDTFQLTGSWYGTDNSAARLAKPPNGPRWHIPIQILGANPGIWVKSGGGLNKVSVSLSGNGGIGVFNAQMNDAQVFEDDNFYTGLTNDYMSIAFYDYQSSVSGGFGGKMRNTSWEGGPDNATVGRTVTPIFATKFNYQWDFDYVSCYARGYAFIPFNAGLFGSFHMGEECQGNVMPVIMIVPATVGNTSGSFKISQPLIDTGPAPLIANLGPLNATTNADIIIEGGNLPSAGQPLISGRPFSGSIQLIGLSPGSQAGQNINVTSFGKIPGSNVAAQLSTSSIKQSAINYTSNHTLLCNEGIVNAQANLTFTIDTTCGDGQSWDAYSEAGSTALTVSAGVLHGPTTVPNNSAAHIFLKGGNAYASLGGGGGSVGTGTQNCIVDWLTTSSLGSVCTNVSGQIPVANNGAAPTYLSPSMVDSPNSPVTTTPYLIACDSATTIIDRTRTIRFQTGASAITVPLSSASGCGGLVTTVFDDGAGTLTFTRTVGDTLTIVNGTSALDAQTSFTLSNGQYATLSQNATNLWLVRVAIGASAGVSSFSGDGALLSNSSSTGPVVATLAAAAANKVWANCTTSSGTPTYCSMTIAMLPTGIPNANLANPFTTVNTQTCTLGSTCTVGYPNIPAGAIANTTTATTQAAGDSSTDLATDQFVTTAVSNAIAAVNPAVAVLAATTGSNLTGTYSNGASGIGATFTVTATGTFTLDGVAINTIGQRVLLKDQTSGFQNGVYTATIVGAVAVSPVFTRALDYDQPSDINSTGAIPVQSGTVNASTSWLLTSTVNTVGTDALTYVQFSIAPTNLSQKIANGTAVMGTSAIASGACATVVTSSGTGIATTDVITVGFNSDPTAVTGYGASATGAVLTIYPYPTTNNANFKVCNSTASSITPGALTLNWKVVR